MIGGRQECLLSASPR